MTGNFCKSGFLKHCVSARNTKGYGVHSPFLFDFTRSVIMEKRPFYCFSQIERLRRVLYADKRVLPSAGQAPAYAQDVTVGQFARKYLYPSRLSQLLFRTAVYFKAHNILELGTGLGVTTAYLASASSDAACITVEPDAALLEIARANFRTLGLQNIRTVGGNIGDLLPLILSEAPLLDLVVFNTGCPQEVVDQLFGLCMQKKHNDSVFVIIGIHESEAMGRAWRQIQENPEVTATIDLFSAGYVFFNKYLAKKNYKMRFRC